MERDHVAHGPAVELVACAHRRRRGATLAAAGAGAVNGTAVVQKVIVPALLAPVIAGTVAMLAVRLARRLTASASATHSERGFKRGQIASASLISIAHGTNDAQKTMGIITLALVAHGTIGADADVPVWVVISAALAIGAGTYCGGWRIIRTMGARLTDITPRQGFSSDSSAAAVILTSSHFGFPLSTTHVATGGILGAGVGARQKVRWTIAGRMVVAWLITLPAAALVAAAMYGVAAGIGGNAGIVAVAIVAVLCGGVAWAISRRDPVNAGNVTDVPPVALVAPEPAATAPARARSRSPARGWAHERHTSTSTPSGGSPC